MNIRKQAGCLLICVTSVLGATSVHAQVSEKSLRALTLCDASFFKQIKLDFVKNPDAVPIKSKGNIGWIQVPDRKKDTNFVDFKTPMKVADMELVSYYDELTDLAEGGQFYYWGFNINGDVEDVVKKVRPLMKDASRLVEDGGSYARVDVKIGKANWAPTKPVSGTVPEANKIERILLIEKHEKRAGLVRLSCSLQGQVTKDVLKALRPDL
jgi:hypothetical protein